MSREPRANAPADDAAETVETAEIPEIPGQAADDVAERPGTSTADHDHADKLADEWGEESFPGSDPPAHY